MASEFSANTANCSPAFTMLNPTKTPTSMCGACIVGHHARLPAVALASLDVVGLDSDLDWARGSSLCRHHDEPTSPVLDLTVATSCFVWQKQHSRIEQALLLDDLLVAEHCIRPLSKHILWVCSARLSTVSDSVLPPLFRSGAFVDDSELDHGGD